MMKMQKGLPAAIALTVAALMFVVQPTPSVAQFSGPSVQGAASTVAAAQNARLGSYVTLTGNVVSHLRSDYFMFRDDTGEIRVEIANNVWRGREVTPTTRVRIMGEIDRGWAGRYLWVKSLEIVE